MQKKQESSKHYLAIQTKATMASMNTGVQAFFQESSVGGQTKTALLVARKGQGKVVRILKKSGITPIVTATHS